MENKKEFKLWSKRRKAGSEKWRKRTGDSGKISRERRAKTVLSQVITEPSRESLIS